MAVFDGLSLLSCAGSCRKNEGNGPIKRRATENKSQLISILFGQALNEGP